jgi:hypothetical protein
MFLRVSSRPAPVLRRCNSAHDWARRSLEPHGLYASSTASCFSMHSVPKTRIYCLLIRWSDDHISSASQVIKASIIRKKKSSGPRTAHFPCLLSSVILSYLSTSHFLHHFYTTLSCCWGIHDILDMDSLQYTHLTIFMLLFLLEGNTFYIKLINPTLFCHVSVIYLHSNTIRVSFILLFLMDEILRFYFKISSC